MTPFGEKVRALRTNKGVNQAQMATALDVSAAYLSALEHGRRGMPSWAMIQKIIQYFGLIWDEAEELHALAQQSKPKVTIDTTGLDPRATQVANRLALRIARLQGTELDLLLDILEQN
ncbi:helix-turn-helix domain-containing protein [Kordiimonas aquimaris]|uniref:helix-turn-helix domain-containing protein n=1 Tax=Kordiimonas aquimaris TaxID=707591 RepID=UPI0021D051B0|nr:helix-turn-helix domain-containing protein [Kordiimonas aquimaris]